MANAIVLIPCKLIFSLCGQVRTCENARAALSLRACVRACACWCACVFVRLCARGCVNEGLCGQFTTHRSVKLYNVVWYIRFTTQMTIRFINFCWAGHLPHHQHEGLHCLHFTPCLRIRDDTFVEQVTCYIINMQVFIVFTSFHVYVFVMILLLSRSLATSSTWRSSLSSRHSMFTYSWWYFCWAGHLLHHQHEGLHCLHFIPCLRSRDDTFVEQVTCYIINMKVFIVFTSLHVCVFVMTLLLSRSLATSSTWRSSLSSLHSMFTYS